MDGQITDKESIKKIIIEECTKNHDLSFAALEHRTGQARTDGDSAWTYSMGSRPNHILWQSRNQGIIEAVVELVRDKKIKMTSCGYMIYLIDGMMLNYPLVKRLQKTDYKKPHWLPVYMELKEGAAV